jgi:predicted nuclease with TOPRIM domain
MQKQILILALCLMSVAVSAQLSKDEKKALKEELKEQLKDLEAYKKKKQQTKEELEAKNQELEQLRKNILEASTKNVELETKLVQEQAKVKEAEAKAEEAAKTQDPTATPMGTVFKLQIGLYKSFDISADLDTAKFVTYEDVDGHKRYIISYFTTEAAAEKFKLDIRKLGIKDAFVAKYVDRQRIFEWEKNPRYKNRPAPNTPSGVPTTR